MGSEMCIRDRAKPLSTAPTAAPTSFSPEMSTPTSRLVAPARHSIASSPVTIDEPPAAAPPPPTIAASPVLTNPPKADHVLPPPPIIADASPPPPPSTPSVDKPMSTATEPDAKPPLSTSYPLAVVTPLSEQPEVLRVLCEAVERAVLQSSGEGGESSGSGRPEWGTWCDTDLFNTVRDALADLSVSTTRDNMWARLWANAGGERPTATLRVAGGTQWDLLLHLFSPSRKAVDSKGNVQVHVGVKHVDGVLSLLQPLLGSVVVSKRRPSGEVFGSPRKLDAGKSRPFLQLGGPSQTYEAITSSAAMLEVVMRHAVRCITSSPAVCSVWSGRARRAVHHSPLAPVRPF